MVVGAVVEHAKQKVGLPLDEKDEIMARKTRKIGCDPTSLV